MALRLHSEYYSESAPGQAATHWRIEVYNKATPVDVNVEFSSVSGATFSYDGKDDLFSEVIPVSCEFDMYVDDVNKEAFVTQVQQAPEGDIQLKVYQNSVLFFIGNVLSDQIQIISEPMPYELKVMATDGIGRLKNIDYTAAAPISFKDFLIDAISQTETLNLLSPGDAVLQTSVSWYENRMNVGADELIYSPLSNARIDTQVFIKEGRGKQEYKSYYYILKEICKAWGARLIFANGSFWFVQLEELEQSPAKVIHFDEQGQQISETTIDHRVDIDKIASYVLAQGTYSNFSAVKQVKLTYYTDSIRNWLHQPINTLNPLQNLYNVYANEGKARFVITGKIKIKAIFEGPNILGTDLTFALKIKIGAYYLSRTFPYPTVELLEWTTDSNASYEIKQRVSHNPAHGDNTEYRDIIVDIYTPALPDSGDGFFSLEESEKVDDNAITTQDRCYTSFDFLNPYMELFGGGDISSQFDSTEYNKYTDITGNNVILPVELYFGDGPFETNTGAIRYFDGVDWKTSSSWRTALSEDFSFQELLMTTILRFRGFALEKYRCAIYGDYMPHETFNDGHATYLLTNGSYETRYGTITGQYAKIAKGSPVILSDPPKNTHENTLAPSGGGGGGNTGSKNDGLGYLGGDLIHLLGPDGSTAVAGKPDKGTFPNYGFNNTALGFSAFENIPLDGAGAYIIDVADFDLSGIDKIVTIPGHGLTGTGHRLQYTYTDPDTSPIVGLISDQAYTFDVVDSNTLSLGKLTIALYLDNLLSTEITLTPYVEIDNSTAIGAGADVEISNQIVLGNDEVIELKVAGVPFNFGTAPEDLSFFIYDDATGKYEPKTFEEVLNLYSIDADLLGGENGNYYLDFNNAINPPTIADYSPVSALTIGQSSRSLDFEEFHNFLWLSDQRFVVTGGDGNIFDGSYDSSYTIPAGASETISINLLSGIDALNANGITYAKGKIFVYFYFGTAPESISGRVKDRDNNWSDVVFEDDSISSWSRYKGIVTLNNYLVELELTVTAPAGSSSRITQAIYLLNRKRPTEVQRLQYFSKTSDQILLKNLGFGISPNETLHLGNGNSVRVDDLANAGYLHTDANGKFQSGTQGAGGGFDADKLDGQHGAHYLDYNNLTNTPTLPVQLWSEASGNIYRATGKVLIGTSTADSYTLLVSATKALKAVGFVKFTSYAGYGFIGADSTGLLQGGDQGAGGGFDADLLDGQHGAYYLNFINFINTPSTLYGANDSLSSNRTLELDGKYIHFKSNSGGNFFMDATRGQLYYVSGNITNMVDCKADFVLIQATGVGSTNKVEVTKEITRFHGAVAKPESITVTESTTQNNLDPPNLSSANTLILDGTSSYWITGIQQQENGFELLIINDSTQTISLAAGNTNSSAANRFAGSGLYDIVSGRAVSIRYSTATNRWHICAP